MNIESVNSNSASPQNQHEIQRVAQDFESLFLHQLLKVMRSSLNDAWDITGGGFGSNMMRDMMDGELARHMSQGGGIGLSELLTHQLAPEEANSSRKNNTK